jgi:uncharacterized OB-fold protein
VAHTLTVKDRAGRAAGQGRKDKGIYGDVGGLTMPEVPIVDYLVLGGEPHLQVHQCTTCGARYFDHRNACANCEGREFAWAPVATSGIVRSFTIVATAAPGIEVPFVAAVVDCDGTSVRTNLVNVPRDPEHVQLGMKVRLTTFSIGSDEHGTEAVAFGFEPLH